MSEATEFAKAQVFGQHDGQSGRRNMVFRDGKFRLDEQGNLHIETQEGYVTYNWRYWESIKTDEEIESERANFNEEMSKKLFGGNE
ncbi:hypothetical protein [Haloarcula marina]|uniref:hypothetical protein n=1 Tax=Haloarcula marina TaxID=2961574 RepID=UPI0020B8006E|nr:hypothetical protein [Halomicroarcula marina]